MYFYIYTSHPWTHFGSTGPILMKNDGPGNSAFFGDWGSHFGVLYIRTGVLSDAVGADLKLMVELSTRLDLRTTYTVGRMTCADMI